MWDLIKMKVNLKKKNQDKEKWRERCMERERQVGQRDVMYMTATQNSIFVVQKSHIWTIYLIRLLLGYKENETVRNRSPK